MTLHVVHILTKCCVRKTWKMGLPLERLRYGNDRSLGVTEVRSQVKLEMLPLSPKKEILGFFFFFN